MLDLPQPRTRTAVRLRPYQVEAVEGVRSAVRRGTRRCLLVAPTGSGKTTIASELIRLAAVRDRRALFVAHRRELITQAYQRLLDFGIPPSNVSVIMANDRRRNPGAHVQVASIDTLRNRAKPRADLVIVDECHRALASSYRDLQEHYARAVHLGLTATPYRADGRGLGDAYDDLVVVTSPRALIADGYLVEPRVFTVPPSALPDLSAVRTRGGDYDKRALEDAVDQKSLVGNLVEHWRRYAEGVRTIVFASSVAHSQHITERFMEAGIPAEHLDGTTPNDERDAILARLASGETLVVPNVGVLCLDAETEILTQSGWVGMDSMTTAHQVANWDQGRITFEEPLEVVRRYRLPGERMVVLRGRCTDIRVTEGHDLVYRTAAHGPYLKKPARELVRKTVKLPACGRAKPSPVRMPHARRLTMKRCAKLVVKNRWNIRHLEGLPEEEAQVEAIRRVLRRHGVLRRRRPEELSLAQCQFIGFWLGDGSAHKLHSGGVEYLLFQIKGSPIVEWVDALLDRMAVHFKRRERRIPDGPSPNGLPIKQTRPLISWSLCRGTGGGSQERRGLYGLEPYLVKQGSTLLWGLNKAQFEALLHGFWMADGDHQEGADWLPHGFRLYQKDRRVLDLLQAIAAARGFRTYLKPLRRDGMHALYMTRNGKHSVPPRRIQFEQVPWRPERVWCVRTRTGAIVTRRNGKVAVLGNCEGFDSPPVKCAILARPTKSTGLYLQMAGRILRPWQDQPAIILDHAGCVMEHGLPQQDREFSLKGTKKRPGAGGGEPPAKMCPECFAVVPLSVRECPACGAQLGVVRDDVEETPDELVEVTVDDVQRLEWQRLQALASLRGYKPGWAIHRFREKFGEAPSAAIQGSVSAVADPAEQRRAVYDAMLEEEGGNSAWAAVRFRADTGQSAPRAG